MPLVSLLAASLALAAPPPAFPTLPAPQQPVLERSKRTRQGLRWLTSVEPGVLGPAHATLVLEHEPLTLDEAAKGALEAGEPGTRFALSGRFAATLDTDVRIHAARKKLDPGLYLLLAQKEKRDGWSILFVPLGEALAVGWDGTGAPSFVSGRALPAEVTRVERKGEPRAAVSFGFGTNPEDPDLHVWLGDLSLTLSLEAEAKKGQPAAWKEDGMRATYRMATMAQEESRGGFVTVGHGPLPHAAELEAELQGLEEGQRFHLARDFWSNWAASLPVRLGERSIPPGERSLALERGADGAWLLVLLDTDRRRKDLLDAFHVAEARKDVELVPLAHAALEAPADVLELAITFADQAYALEIRWGPHRWSTPLALEFP
jgi:hypothetical protein